MSIKFECPVCRNQLSAKSDYAGKEGKCKCGAAVIVPGRPEEMKFACRQCGKGISVLNRYAGKKGKCPTCKSVVTVPLLGILVWGEADVSGGGPAEAASSDMISFVCAKCSATIKANQNSIGRIIKCPECGRFADIGGSDIIKIGGGVKAMKSTGKVRCPSCERKLADNAHVCTRCGIYVKNGRPILTAWDVDAEELKDKAQGVVSGISWIIPLGIYPVYSEAMGNHRPYATWGITVVTVLISIWFLVLGYCDSPQMMSAKNLMLWNGDAKPHFMRIMMSYRETSYGDKEAFKAKREELKGTVPEKELDVATLNALTPEQRCFGEYRHYQLVTHAFLHIGIIHLAGNMLFLLVLGSRVNSAIGNILTVILYPILAITAALVHLASLGAGPPMAMLGASGAVMGLAGAYLILFPIHKVYMVIWFRWLLTGFRLSYGCIAVPGFLVVLFYIMFDVIAVSLTLESGTAHWAHIGGFVGGILIAFVLLIGRMAYSRSDMLSLVLGKHAWKIIGTPESRMK